MSQREKHLDAIKQRPAIRKPEKLVQQKNSKAI